MAHHWYALYLAAMERPSEAIEEEHRAQELEPLSLIINKNVGTILHYARRYDQAIEQYRKTLELDQDFVRAHFYLGLSYRQTSRFEEAIAALHRRFHFREAARSSWRRWVALMRSLVDEMRR